MAELEIAQLGHPILYQQAQPVERFTDTKTQQFIEDLLATAIAAQGVGIAAPQVSVSRRLFIVASHPTPRYPQAPSMPPTAMLNPKILSRSPEMVKDWEGCLSISGLRGLVPRATSIDVEYTDRDGNHHQQQLSGFVARIFQHELDHLNGILFIDRIESTRDLFTEQSYQQRIGAEREKLRANANP
ncbi:MAG: peptide deformylase [Cyanophyceae cyanobacterium]